MLLRAANFYSKDLIGSMFKVDFSQCIKCGDCNQCCHSQ